ncbi:MAG: hypothetical protein Q8L88_09900 [Bacteroidota bacterium]|nr:hypothetical protein [Bacteroidota bacterium]
MPILIDKTTYNLFSYDNEADFENCVEQLADHIFGNSTIYISKKKRMKGSEIISIPDAYLIDMTNPSEPDLYIIENEIISHDPFKHIGIQLLRFATSFDEGKVELRNHLMDVISKNKQMLERLENGCSKSNHRNIDNYLDSAVYKQFKALVIIDEAKDELHNVLQKINANISVLELKSFISDNGEKIYHYDTLYENEEIELAEGPVKTRSNEDIIRMRERRSKCDTIVVPAREDGFKAEFLKNNQWYAIRISAAMKDKIKYIAAYRVAPVSAITHVAEVDTIIPYQKTGKYLLKFKSPASEITPVKLKDSNKKPQGPIYVKYENLIRAKYFDDVL